MKTASAPAGKRRRNPVLVFLLMSLLGILLAISILFPVLLLFLRGMSQNTTLPELGCVPAEQLASLLGSWLSLALGIAVPLVPILMIVLINWHSESTSVLTMGCSVIASAILTLLLAGFRMPILQILNGDWQDALVGVMTLFRDYCRVLAMLQFAVGVLMLSLHRCICLLKRNTGGTHEKSA